MTTLFNIGDEIEVTLKGKVKKYSVSENGDCYVIELTNIDPEGTSVYLDSKTLSNATKLNNQHRKMSETEMDSEKVIKAVNLLDDFIKGRARYDMSPYKAWNVIKDALAPLC